MNQEAIDKLKEFQIKNHLSGYNLQEPQGEQTDTVSGSSVKPTKKINYPEHIKPLKERIMSALSNGCRTPESVANYCGENVKLITLQLGRWVSRGMIGRHTNVVSGITRYYPHDIAKEKGFLTKPQPILRKKKTKEIKNRSSSFAPVQTTKPSLYTAEFLERQVVEWQKEARKQAHEIEDLKAKLSEAQVQLIKARQTRDVTSEVTEVMQEVIKLRATVEYLESKLFGRN